MNTLQKQQLKESIEKHFPKSQYQDSDVVDVDQLKRAIAYMSTKQQQTQGQQTIVASTKLLLHALSMNPTNNNNNDNNNITSQQLQQKLTHLLSQQSIKDPTTTTLLFQLIDTDKDGLINIDDFKTYLSSIGSTMEHNQIQQFFQLLSPQGLHLNKQQFAVILKHL